MKSSYAIAYCNKDGGDFYGVPWILDDMNNKEECISKTLDMIADGFQSVIPFQFEHKRGKQEEFSWEYVKENKINLK